VKDLYLSGEGPKGSIPIEMGLRDPFDPVQAIPCAGKISSQASQAVRKSRTCGGGLQCGRRPD
jgi:hypothetical protein